LLLQRGETYKKYNLVRSVQEEEGSSRSVTLPKSKKNKVLTALDINKIEQQ
jgi:hypothetical protein